MNVKDMLGILGVLLIGFILGALFVGVWVSVYHRGTCSVCLKQDASVHIVHNSSSVRFNVCDACAYELLKDKVK